MVYLRQIPALLLCVCLSGLIGCDQSEPTASTTKEVADGTSPRIISLAPALSQMLDQMGMVNFIVGVQKDDFVVDKSIPVVGTYVEVNTERLITLQPTHVLMMVGKEGVPTSLTTLADQGGFKLATWSYPDNIQSVADILWHPTEQCLGNVFDRPELARLTREKMLIQLELVKQATSFEPNKSVLIVLGTQPLMASGSNTVFNDLMQFVNATNVAAEATVKAPVYDREKLLALQPEVVLMMQPYAMPLEDFEKDDRLKVFRGLDIPAVKDKRIVMLNDPLVYLPATNLPYVAADIAKAIHPQLAEQIDLLFETESQEANEQSD